jgi:uncharacterized protein YjbI with pentapeptide repeats
MVSSDHPEQPLLVPSPAQSAVYRWLLLIATVAGLLIAMVWIYQDAARAKLVGFEDKKLWQWLELLVVPFVLAIAVWLFDHADRRTEQDAARALQDYEFRFTEKLSAVDRELRLKIDNQRTVEAFLEYVSNQVLSSAGNTHIEAQGVVLRTYILETLDSLSTDETKRTKAIGFLHELEIFKRKDRRRRSLDLEPLLVGAVLSDFDGNLLNPRHEQEAKPKDLREIDFSKCTLLNCRLNGSDLENTKFEGANLAGAQLVEVSLLEAVLRNATLDKANLSRADLTRANLANGRLRGATLVGINANSANFNGCELDEADFSGADLTNATFELARFHGVVMDEATLIDAKWRLIWEVLNLRQEAGNMVLETPSSLLDALTDSPVRSRDLRERELSYADLSGADLRCFDLTDANLAASMLVGADLSGAILAMADLTGADLNGADLAGAFLEGAELTDEQLQFARNVPEREASFS